LDHKARSLSQLVGKAQHLQRGTETFFLISHWRIKHRKSQKAGRGCLRGGQQGVELAAAQEEIIVTNDGLQIPPPPTDTPGQ
jgi:hypothetical protein